MSVIQSLNFAYIGRKLKKRNFKKIWIYRINTASRLHQISYSIFIGNLRRLNIFLNRNYSSKLNNIY